MAEISSTKMLLMATSLVLLLSFKDLVFIRTDSTTNEAAAAKQKSFVGSDDGAETAAFDNSGRHDKDADEAHHHHDEFEEEDGEAASRRHRSVDGHDHDHDDDEGHNESKYEDDEAEFGGDGSSGSRAAAAAGSGGEKKIPSLKMMKNTAGLQQTLKFKFCYSCGYRNAFEQYSQMIQTRFPEIKIVGENYAPVTWKLYLAQFLSTSKMLLIGCIMFSYNPFTQFNMATPAVFNWALQNKFYASIMMFFLSNSIETHLISTGAFEIYLNDIQIWSKLASDRMPHEKELMQILDTNFNFETEKNAAFENMK